MADTSKPIDPPLTTTSVAPSIAPVDRTGDRPAMAQLATHADVQADNPAPAREPRGLTPRAAWWVRLMPVFIVAPLSPLVATKPTRDFFYWLVSEDRPVEILTFVALMLATYIGVRLVVHLRRGVAPRWVWLFYAIFTLGVFVTGMEEIAWGQWIFFFKTPDFWDKLNAQHELTLHNYKAMQGHTEYIRGIFCIGALIGLLLGRARAFAQVAVPTVLASWVLIMLAQVIADTLNDHVPLGPDFFIDRFSEVIEMMVGLTAYLYLRLNANKLGLADGRKFLLRRALW
ncbi:hypothetical protein BH09PLA1_BH09PLA1_09110 [soil metagenome]